MYHIRLTNMRSHKHGVFILAPNYLKQAVAAHYARRSLMSGYRMIVIIKAVSLADYRIITVIIALAERRRSDKRLRNTVAEIYDSILVLRLIIASRKPQYRKRDKHNRKQNAQCLFCHNSPLALYKSKIHLYYILQVYLCKYSIKYIL